MNVVFYDCASPAEYSDGSLNQSNNKIGGAEATIIRIAVELAKNHRVTVAQRVRRQSVPGSAGTVSWTSIADAKTAIATADIVVLIRMVGEAIQVRRLNRRARLIVWYHDWYFEIDPKRHFLRRLQMRLRSDLRSLFHLVFGITAVGVSQTHVTNIREHLYEGLFLRRFVSRIAIDFVYNPIVLPSADLISPTYDPTKLIYFSAPWKGLDLVLERFAFLSGAMPDMTLYVASPGYELASTSGGAGRMVNLGNLTHADLFRHVSSSLCVFYPANRIPETFGLVFAESHAVRTPVLAHPFGAAPELLSPTELVDAMDMDAIVERIRDWRSTGRPVVKANPALELSRVVARWEELLRAA